MIPYKHLPIFLLLAAALLLLLAGCGGGSGQSDGNQDATSEEQLRSMMTKIATEADWDLSGELVWSYFFLHRDKAPLEILGNRLAGDGYQVVDIFKSSEENPMEYGLHVQRLEHHDLTTLAKRSEEMQQLANESGIDLFDGVEVAATEDSSEGYEQVWWTYDADYDGKPGRVSLNIGLKPMAPMLRYPTLLVTGISYTREDEKGQPNDAEQQVLDQVRMDRITFLKLNTPAIEAGGLILDGDELQYIYLRDPTGVKELLQDYYDANFPDRKYTINIKDNVDWEAYLDLLYPNDATVSFYEEELKELNLFEWFDQSEASPNLEAPPGE